MGADIRNVDGSEAEAGKRISDGTTEYICAYFDGSESGGAIVQGEFLALSYDTSGTTFKNPKVITIAALAVYRHLVVALEATSTAGWYWFAIKGPVDALVDGDAADVTVGDYLDVTPGTNAIAAILDHATVRSTASIASALEGNTATNALKEVYLLGDRVIVP